MPPERRRKIPAAVWLKHKPLIKHLRENPTMTMNMIVEIMKSKHSFDAS
jgi:uncharacterized protein YneF (UPF0154 family)